MTGKYPRTPHLPYSPGASSDDKIAKDVNGLVNVPVVITEKLDGGNSSLEYDAVYARTHAISASHPSFDWLKRKHAELKSYIPPELQVFGEYVYAVHSIKYDCVPSYFFLFGVRDRDKNQWASWEYLEGISEILELPTAPLLWSGAVKTESELRNLVEQLARQRSVFGGTREGVVIRVAKSFDDKEFSACIAKWVRPGHVQETEQHWSLRTVVKQRLCSHR